MPAFHRAPTTAGDRRRLNNGRSSRWGLFPSEATTPSQAGHRQPSGVKEHCASLDTLFPSVAASPPTDHSPKHPPFWGCTHQKTNVGPGSPKQVCPSLLPAVQEAQPTPKVWSAFRCLCHRSPIPPQLQGQGLPCQKKHSVLSPCRPRTQRQERGTTQNIILLPTLAPPPFHRRKSHCLAAAEAEIKRRLLTEGEALGLAR